MPQYEFVGFQNAQVEHTVTQRINLADFYNPHADDLAYAPADAERDDRLFPSGSTYGAGTPKPKILSISVSSGWCSACKREAKNVIPAKHAHFKPLGGEFLVQLNDGPSQGHAAVAADLVDWTSQFHVDFPATIDASRQLDALFIYPAYPTNILLDTRKMKIVDVVVGVPDEAYWTRFESALVNP